MDLYDFIVLGRFPFFTRICAIDKAFRRFYTVIWARRLSAEIYPLLQSNQEEFAQEAMSSDIEIGSTVEGTVVKLADYGAIVRLPGGKMGLIHISEVTDAYVRDVRDYFRENDRVVVKVLKLNNKGRYELSAKQAEAPPVPRLENAPPEQERPRPPRADTSYRWEGAHKPPAHNFEEQLSRFMKDSEERMHDIKRSVEAKRGRARR